MAMGGWSMVSTTMTTSSCTAPVCYGRCRDVGAHAVDDDDD
jgi:hypothetical protein